MQYRNGKAGEKWEVGMWTVEGSEHTQIHTTIHILHSRAMIKAVFWGPQTLTLDALIL